MEDFITAIAIEQPQIIALQEVNQTCCKAVVPGQPEGYYACGSPVVIREDNHVYRAVQKLCQRGVAYYWTWLPIKKGYDKYDEGIALMSRSPITDIQVVNISGIQDYNNWKTRKILGICTKAAPDEWFFSVHYGWWDDKEEPFQEQWKRTEKHMETYKQVWLMGDFNNPAEVRGEGYDMIAKSHWHDSYVLTDKKDLGMTVEHVIDGWKDKITDTHGMRIDQIWCNRRVRINNLKVLFNGRNYPIISDHFGVMIDSAK